MKRNPPNSSLRGNIMVSVLAAVGSAALALAITSWIWSWPLTIQAADRAVVAVNVSEVPVTRETKVSTSFAPIVKHVAPSLVYVYSTKTAKHPFGREMRPLFDDPFFRRFFGDRFDEDENSPARKPRTETEHGLGSGVVISKVGHILTNNHVVDGADEIKVSLFDDKRDFTAKVVGRDAKTDIAVLKSDAHNLPTATLADSDKIEVGDVVLAIGNPFGIGQTATMGIVRATRRGGMGIEEYEDFIQTDAAIDPGNSGGALVDADGRLVGICSGAAEEAASSSWMKAKNDDPVRRDTLADREDDTL